MQVTDFRTGALRRGVLVLTLGWIALLGTAGQVGAVEPIDLRDPEPTSPPRTTPQPAPTVAPAPTPPSARTLAPTPTPTPTPAPPLYGLDVSYPQCDDELPDAFAFAIVGVNGGRVYSDNPCLVGSEGTVGQLEWAGEEVQLYANTGNPGPEVSRYWPSGQATPQPCATAANPGRDTAACAYNYGWHAAADSYRTALDAFVALELVEPEAGRLPGDLVWWLDVETANSWRLDRGLNVATLRGAVDYLESMGVAEVGFYSTPLLWWLVTGGSSEFAEHPAWHAGASDMADARDRCDDEAFTGGELRMVQWVENGLDHNIRCS